MHPTLRLITVSCLLLTPLAAAPAKREAIPLAGWVVHVHHEFGGVFCRD
ncbi:MAG: hypothetical protein KA250_14385 [Verrucomicrobiales bacterium]|nr:hypothetical protein [Verrucomicrobiales bacterium]MBP9226211.1 hypothetical protein [Verrucomicrobiales bacterium]HQZ29468.1 hypothetical protein [Verrucomicrobiales bacterium]